MKNRVVWLVAALMLGFVTTGASQAQEVTNLFQNPGFETGALAPWGGYSGGSATITSTVVTDCVGANVPEGPIEGNYCLHVKVSGPGTNFWDGSIEPPLLPGARVFQKGKKYTLSLFFKSKSGTATINLKPELARDPWTGYGETQVTATEKWAEYHTTTPVFTADVNPAHVTVHVQFKAQEFWIDDVRWYEGDYVRRHAKAYAPVPSDGAVGIGSPVLMWTPGDTAVWHNVYVGTNTHLTAADCRVVGQVATTYAYTGGWQSGFTYYWRVDEVAADGTLYTGDLWHFVARGKTAYSPRPADGAVVADLNPVLLWEPGLGAIRHQVFFGTKLEAVATGTGDVQKATVTTPLYLPGKLDVQTTYYWRVDEFDGTRTYRGPVWSFTVVTMEGFETNDFSRFPWESGDGSSWTITSKESHSGLYSARAGPIGNDESSSLILTQDVSGGTISFWCKVSCEDGADRLEFSIDGIKKGEWTGERDWKEVSFPVQAGVRTFTWSYIKDSSSSFGEDTAWIDDVLLPL
jgi:hypothetical protein